jgi:hypothetical protein
MPNHRCIPSYKKGVPARRKETQLFMFLNNFESFGALPRGKCDLLKFTKNTLFLTNSREFGLKSNL